jgi:hypothetical protein
MQKAEIEKEPAMAMAMKYVKVLKSESRTSKSLQETL